MTKGSDNPEEPIRELAGHEGILGVTADPEHARLEIDYDPARLSENDLRAMASEDAADLSNALRKLCFRLESASSEAGAL